MNAIDLMNRTLLLDDATVTQSVYLDGEPTAVPYQVELPSFDAVALESLCKAILSLKGTFKTYAQMRDYVGHRLGLMGRGAARISGMPTCCAAVLCSPSHPFAKSLQVCPSLAALYEEWKASYGTNLASANIPITAGTPKRALSGPWSQLLDRFFVMSVTLSNPMLRPMMSAAQKVADRRLLPFAKSRLHDDMKASKFSAMMGSVLAWWLLNRTFYMESSFNVMARYPKGYKGINSSAIGVGQLVNKTAKGLAAKISMYSAAIHDLELSFGMPDGTFRVSCETARRSDGQYYLGAPGYPNIISLACDVTKSLMLWTSDFTFASRQRAYPYDIVVQCMNHAGLDANNPIHVFYSQARWNYGHGPSDKLTYHDVPHWASSMKNMVQSILSKDLPFNRFV